MGWLQRRVWAPMISLLRQGTAPEALARSVAVGLALGICPLWGTSTVLCLGAATLFRLNHAAVQLANYLAYPLQLALLLPFIRLGERIFHAPRLPLSAALLGEAFRTNGWSALGLFWTSLWHAAVAWLLAVPAPAALLAACLLPLFRRAGRSFQRP